MRTVLYEAAADWNDAHVMHVNFMAFRQVASLFIPYICTILQTLSSSKLVNVGKHALNSTEHNDIPAVTVHCTVVNHS